MKKAILIIALVVASFLSGFAFRELLHPQTNPAAAKKVTGIGGIFFKCRNPETMRNWYAANLGLKTNAYGAVFEWYQGADSTRKGFTSWNPFRETTTYFAPSQRDFMINYRVGNLEVLLDELRRNGVTVLDSIQTYDYGKFAHVLDVEGNKLELWEPNDIAYEQLGARIGATTTK